MASDNAARGRRKTLGAGGSPAPPELKGPQAPPEAELPPTPPGAEQPRRYRPKLRYELIGCGLHGHELVGTDAADVREQDSLFAREMDGLRWYRCMRCDSWIPLSPPSQPAVQYPPEREDITLPLRGRPLRDRYALRLIALDRIIHFLVLSALAAALLLFANDKATLNSEFTRILKELQGGVGGPVNDTNHGLLHDLERLFALTTTNLYLLGAGVAAYAALEGVEAIGLWLGKRWAEYLTFVATVVFVPYEIYELTKGISALKIVTLVINLVIVVYLVYAKRLFGVHGGGRAERAVRQRDTGWEAIERATPEPRQTPAAAPSATANPFTTGDPVATANPFTTGDPDATANPYTTEEPAAAATPFTTEEPAAAANPFTTGEPAATATPSATGKPPGTAAPSATEEPAPVHQDGRPTDPAES